MPDAEGKSLIWGSRFSQGPHPLFFAYGRSIGWDQRLAPEDIRGSIAHVHALRAAGVLSGDIAQELEAALRRIAEDLARGEVLPIVPSDEDVHGAIERLLGPVGAYLHAGRSRNDQVALDFHLFCKEAAGLLEEATARMQAAVLGLAEAQGTKLWWGMTHLQTAQPVLVAHHLLAYFWMFERDRRRFAWARRQADSSPLGAGALAGAGLPLDPRATAQELGLGGIYGDVRFCAVDRDHDHVSALLVTVDPDDGPKVAVC